MTRTAYVLVSSVCCLSGGLAVITIQRTWRRIISELFSRGDV